MVRCYRTELDLWQRDTMSFPPRDSIALSTLHDYLTFAWLLLVGYNFRAIGERFFGPHHLCGYGNHPEGALRRSGWPSPVPTRDLHHVEDDGKFGYQPFNRKNFGAYA